MLFWRGSTLSPDGINIISITKRGYHASRNVVVVPSAATGITDSSTRQKTYVKWWDNYTVCTNHKSSLYFVFFVPSFFFHNGSLQDLHILINNIDQCLCLCVASYPQAHCCLLVVGGSRLVCTMCCLAMIIKLIKIASIIANKVLISRDTGIAGDILLATLPH